MLEVYEQLEKKLDEIYIKRFGRCDRNNIDIRNSNPTAMLQVVATIQLIDKMEELIKEIKELKSEQQGTTTTKKTAKK